LSVALRILHAVRMRRIVIFPYYFHITARNMLRIIM